MDCRIRKFHAAAGKLLGLSSWAVMECIEAHPEGIILEDVAEDVGLKYNNCARVVQGLVRMGYVSKRNIDDRSFRLFPNGVATNALKDFKSKL